MSRSPMASPTVCRRDSTFPCNERDLALHRELSGQINELSSSLVNDRWRQRDNNSSNMGPRTTTAWISAKPHRRSFITGKQLPLSQKADTLLQRMRCDPNATCTVRRPRAERFHTLHAVHRHVQRTKSWRQSAPIKAATLGPRALISAFTNDNRHPRRRQAAFLQGTPEAKYPSPKLGRETPPPRALC